MKTALTACRDAISELLDNRLHLDLARADKRMLREALEAANATLKADEPVAPPEPVIPDGMHLFRVVQHRDATHRYEADIVAASADDALAKAEDDECVWEDAGVDDFDDRSLSVYDADDYQERCVLAERED